MFPLIFMLFVWKKFFISREIAINALQTANCLLFVQIMISVNINTDHIRVDYFIALFWKKLWTVNAVLLSTITVWNRDVHNSSRSCFTVIKLMHSTNLKAQFLLCRNCCILSRLIMNVLCRRHGCINFYCKVNIN